MVGPTKSVSDPLNGAVKVMDMMVREVVVSAVKFCLTKLVVPLFICMLKLVAVPNCAATETVHIVAGYGLPSV